MKTDILRNKQKHFCLQPSTPAGSVALPAFAATRRAAVTLPAGPIAAAAAAWAHAGTDRQTDGRVLDRCIDPAAHILCGQCQ